MPATELRRRVFREEGGRMSVARFMQRALYDPAFGYYRRQGEMVGARGDFATSATLSPLLGNAIARWLEMRRREQEKEQEVGRRGGRWNVIEVGAGNGSLARTILSTLGWWRQPNYHIVEISEALCKTQQRQLANRRVTWHGGMQEALAACGGNALVFSNELVDAFPCKVLEWQENRWYAVEIEERSDGEVREVLTERSSDAEQASLCSSVLDWQNPAEGQRVEIHTSYRDWLAQWAPAWRAGRMLTIDYGAPFPELYYRRKRGTLRGYFRQMRMEGAEVWERFARQDLTADVNFTDLERWGAELGWRTQGQGTQREFLLHQLPKLAKGVGTRDPVARQLLDEEGAGGAFRFLEQSACSSLSHSPEQ